MITNPRLHAVAVGQSSAEEAAQVFEETLDSGGSAGGEAVYGALRDWTWKALHSRRLDPGLTEWLGLIEGVRARLPREREDTRARLATLAELVGTSVRFASNTRDEEIARFSHVEDVLEFISRRNGQASRQDLKAGFSFSDSRLSQLLTLLVHSGHLEREPRGRTASFSLTHRGLTLLERMREERGAHGASRASTVATIARVRRALRRHASKPSFEPPRVVAVPPGEEPGADVLSIATVADVSADHRYESNTKLLDVPERPTDRATYTPPVNQVVYRGIDSGGR